MIQEGRLGLSPRQVTANPEADLAFEACGVQRGPCAVRRLRLEDHDLFFLHQHPRLLNV